jgi:chromosome segregation ATPase
MARAGALEQDLEATKSMLETEIASLSTDVEALAQRRWRLEEEVSALSRSEASLKERVTKLSSDLASRENSVFFHAANERELREHGALTAILKRFRDAKDLSFDRSVDLRTGNTIALNAADLGMERIKKVRLLPSIYQVDRDYVIERSEDGMAAWVVLLDPDLFRGKEVLVSIRG